MAENYDLGSYELLKKGRQAYAVAHLRGDGQSSVRGRLSFYDTPIGILVYAEAEGLQTLEGVYGFCLGAEKGKTCMYLPLIYTKFGKGRGFLVSEALRRISLCGQGVFLKENIRSSQNCLSRAVASGVIQGSGRV